MVRSPINSSAPLDNTLILGKTSLDVLLTETKFEVANLETTEFKEGLLMLPRFTVKFGPDSINVSGAFFTHSR